MAKKEEIKDYFECVAPKWDKLRSSFFDEKLRDMVIKRVGVKKGDIALDAGIGTGFIAMGVAKVVGEWGKVIGIDMSEAMLSEARWNLTREELGGRVELVVGDLEKLPIEDRVIDTIVCNMGLHHCHDPQRTVKEMARVLKAGGKLVISDLEKHDEKWLRSEMADVWLGFDLKKVANIFRRTELKDVQVNLARTKCRGISINGRQVAIGIFVAEGRK